VADREQPLSGETAARANAFDRYLRRVDPQFRSILAEPQQTSITIFMRSRIYRFRRQAIMNGRHDTMQLPRQQAAPGLIVKRMAGKIAATMNIIDCRQWAFASLGLVDEDTDIGCAVKTGSLILGQPNAVICVDDSSCGNRIEKCAHIGNSLSAE